MAYLNRQQVANYCGVTERTVSSWLENGRLPANDQQSVDTADLIDFMQVNQFAVPEELIGGKMESSSALLVESAAESLIENNGEDVFIIEDDRPMAIIIERVFRHLDIPTLQIQSESKLLPLLEANKARLITIELENQNLDALRVVEQIKSSSQLNCKVLVISRAIPSVLAKAKELGADVILTKPFDNDSLRRTIKIMLGQI